MRCSCTIRPAARYAFSYIGYNGTMAGGGDTQDARWDNALKYRLTYGPVRFGAMYKFADGSGGCFSDSATWTAATCTPEQPHNTAYGFSLGGEYDKFSADVVFQHYNQAISVLNPLLGPQSLSAPYQSTLNSINTNPITGANLIATTNTVYGIVTDNSACMVAAKYAWDEFKFFGGYEYIWQNNPSNPLGIGASAQGGYLLSGVEDDNLDSQKLVQIWWVGVKYAVRQQNRHHVVLLQSDAERLSSFRRPARPPPVSAAPARAPSTRCQSTRIIISPSVSTLMPESRILRSAAVWPLPFLTAPASPTSTTTTWLRCWAFGSPSDRFRRRDRHLDL